MLVGTCLDLEKPYFRPSAGGTVDPSRVRPLFVLEQSLQHIKDKWRRGEAEVAEEEEDEEDGYGGHGDFGDVGGMVRGREGGQEAGQDPRSLLYAWASEQFKSLRQDMTVQHIKCTGARASTLPLHVYETHARMALEHGDLNE